MIPLQGGVLKGLWNFFAAIGIFFVGIFFISFLFAIFAGINLGDNSVNIKEPSILQIELEGIILDGKKVLKQLNEYAEDKQVKAIVLRVDSPGGVVGPSQEIYNEILRIREKTKKPVVVSAGALLASGAYYISVAADKIIVSPGTLVGSIGVIMEFANLEGLYDWAKIKRYSLKTGTYKDSGATYRSMEPHERELLQGLLDDVLNQFTEAVSKGRSLSIEDVQQVADGRILTGNQAMERKLVDSAGTLRDAQNTAWELAGMKGEPKVFEPPKKRPNFFQIMRDLENESVADQFSKILKGVYHPGLIGKPLFLMPRAGVLE